MKSMFFTLASAMMTGGVLPAFATDMSGDCASPQELVQVQGERSFEQTRLLAGVDMPLVSSGRVTIEADHILWTVTDPIEIVTKISESGMSQSIEGGPEETIGANTSSSLMISQSGLADLIRGDLSNMDSRYVVTELEAADGWSLHLAPADDTMAAYIDHVALEGCAAVTRIGLHQANGDVISVSFQD